MFRPQLGIGGRECNILIMKRIKNWMIVAFSFAALCFTSCDRNGGEEGGGGSGNQDYPSTAQVIRNAVKDIDGNKYDAVKIGDQVWMASNLRTTRYADGTSIPLGTTLIEETPYRHAPGLGQTNEENMANVPTYGYLYNWAAVMHNESSSNANPSRVQGICPNGWHVPSDAEWAQLTNYVSRQDEYCCRYESKKIAKALASTTGWVDAEDVCKVGCDQSSNNATGFSAFPAGIHNDGFGGFGKYADFWSSTEHFDDFAGMWDLEYDEAVVVRGSGQTSIGYSVRCLRD